MKKYLLTVALLILASTAVTACGESRYTMTGGNSASGGHGH